MESLRQTPRKRKLPEPVMPCGPFMGKPIADASDFWLERLAEWRWVRGRLREAVEAELQRRKGSVQ